MSRRRVLAVTGTRAEYGLLRPVLRAIAGHAQLELDLVVTGAHRLAPTFTEREVLAEYPAAACLDMQRDGAVGRCHDAVALGRGVTAIAHHLASAEGAGAPADVVLVLGDRIEAFAAASAAAIGGTRVAHLHGGDVAEGVADDAMRHAITKLAHVHLPATTGAAARLERLGERPETIHVVGSPALDDLDAIGAIDDETFGALGRPDIVMLMHPVGDDDACEECRARSLLDACAARGRVLALHPNHDPGRCGIVGALAASDAPNVVVRDHLDRPTYVGLLRRARVLAGNSSSALIESSVLGLRAVDIGSRQGGRERGGHVVTCPDWEPRSIADALDTALATDRAGCPGHPFGDGRCGVRSAEVLATFDAQDHPLRKRIAFD